MHFKRIIIFILINTLLLTNHLISKERGSTYANLLKLNPDANSMSMGNSIPLKNINVLQLHLNPAVLYYSEDQIGFSHIFYIQGINYDTLGISKKLGFKIFKKTHGLTIAEFTTSDEDGFLKESAGFWSDDDGSEIYGLLVNEENNENDKNYFYRLNYNIQSLSDGNNGYAGFYILLKDIDLSNMEYLVLKMKKLKGNGTILIGLKNIDGKEKKISIDKYISLSSSWQEIKIPLDKFKEIIQGKKMENISFSFEGGEGAVDIDDIAFIDKSASVSKSSVIGITAGLLYSDAMDKVTLTQTPPYYEIVGSFNYWTSVWQISYAESIEIAGLKVPTGITIKGIYEKVDTYKNFLLGMDLGFIHRALIMRKEIIFGLSFLNIGSFLNFKETLPFAIQQNITLGLAESLSGGLNVKFTIDKPVEVGIGLQYNLIKIINLSAGYIMGNDSMPFSGGVGLEYKNQSFYYCITPFSEFGLIHRLSVQIRW